MDEGIQLIGCIAAAAAAAGVTATVAGATAIAASATATAASATAASATATVASATAASATATAASATATAASATAASMSASPASTSAAAWSHLSRVLLNAILFLMFPFLSEIVFCLINIARARGVFFRISCLNILRRSVLDEHLIRSSFC